ncbi:MAG: hypothetical protein ACRDNS_29630, partial [Trebonia sp.]
AVVRGGAMFKQREIGRVIKDSEGNHFFTAKSLPRGRQGTTVIAHLGRRAGAPGRVRSAVAGL